MTFGCTYITGQAFPLAPYPLKLVSYAMLLHEARISPRQ